MNSKYRFIPYQTIVCNYGIRESELIQSCFTMLQAFSLLLVLNSTSKAHLASALEHQMLCSLYSSDLVTYAILKNSDPLALEPKLVFIIVIKFNLT